MRKSLVVVVAALACLLSSASPAHAWLYTNANLTKITVHNYGNGDAIFTFDKDVCLDGTKTAARLFSSTALNYDAIFSMLQAAFLSGAKVDIQTTDDANCSVQYIYISK